MHNKIFKNKKILLGVTGCIAAYKAAFLTRDLKILGAEVKVIMTTSATEFISPLTLSTLSENTVIINTFPLSNNENPEMGTWHIDSALWADLMIIAPCTINTVAKIAHGFADNALTTIVTALRSPLLVCPAADVDMYNNKITQKNIQTLKDFGINILDAEEGELASGLKGKGRLPELNKIIDAAALILSGSKKKDLTNKKILITAGPTYEDIDPVRFIGNRSSGKMGYWLAKASYLRGADVTLISGPSSENIYPEVNYIYVRSADEMEKAVKQNLKTNDILIMSAAVADYRPQKIVKNKIKKENKLSSIKLKENNDILASVDKKDKYVVGFALETENGIANAKKKLKNKDLDMIVLNVLKSKQSGFDTDTNKIKILKKNGNTKDFPVTSKFLAANNILSEIVKTIK
ncbi:MAG: bifunctional phosphopantothenoylcysteine decarboxylase/phosphopantothenate--cysteine ligase CoaBC [Ignavibacteriales bacterium CG12_big_fil_rev_8_21_14_0_65_30_8]|nr:MAG: bifunctional phosphopantothenoylcysteine decarboxylase/phosphopantothenate--cysteine ligase CoaBC [Ignavibacteriales bacterium CG12_big_fil_rev_8_21_14_0_65_30_8]